MKTPRSIDAAAGVVFKRLRENQSISRVSMATRVGVTAAQWGNIERGNTSVNMARFFNIAGVLGIDPGDLFMLVYDQHSIGKEFRDV